MKNINILTTHNSKLNININRLFNITEYYQNEITYIKKLFGEYLVLLYYKEFIV